MDTSKQKEIRRKLLGNGDEPSWNSPIECTFSEVALAIRWYNDNKDDKFAAKLLKCDAKKARAYTSLAWGKRLVERGFVLPTKSLNTIKTMQEKFDADTGQAVEYDQDGNVISTKPVNVKTKIEEGISAKLDFFIGELEGFLDEYVANRSAFKAYEWMVENEVKSTHAKVIVDHFATRAKELMQADAGTDEELKEGYSNFTRNRLRDVIVFVANIIKDAKKIDTNQKVSKVRAPRKKKAVSVDKVVSKLNYKASDTEFKLKSVSPASILGVDQLWVFNTKTRKLGVYKAAGTAGLSVKGSRIMGYDETQSVCRTLRKPEGVLEGIVTGGKLVLRKALDKLTTKETTLNGQINGDTILLRVVK